MALASFHQQMIELAKQSIQNIPATEREISAVTIAVSEKLAAQMKTEIIALRKRFLKWAADEQDADRIVQANFQLFALAQMDGDDE